jgi:hypothetical protein
MNAAPHSDRIALRESLFGLFGGPLAWYLQLCAGYALASGPCFRDGIHVASPSAALQWTLPAMIVSTLAAFAVALFSLLVSWRAFRRAQSDQAGEPAQAGAGRMLFLALWGVILGASFALATAITGAIFIALPRCAG